MSSAKLLGEPDEKPFRAANVAEPVRIFIAHDFVDELCAALAESLERFVDIVHGEHDAEIAQGIHRRIAVIRDDGGSEKAGELETAVTVGGAHHGNLDALAAHSGDASGPFSFDDGAS